MRRFIALAIVGLVLLALIVSSSCGPGCRGGDPCNADASACNDGVEMCICKNGHRYCGTDFPDGPAQIPCGTTTCTQMWVATQCCTACDGARYCAEGCPSCDDADASTDDDAFADASTD